MVTNRAGGISALRSVMQGPDYTAIYLEAWQSILTRAQRELETNEITDCLHVRSADDFRNELLQLSAAQTSDAPRKLVQMLIPSIDHYEEFAASFVNLMDEKGDVSMMWGLIYLVLRLALDCEGAFQRLYRMVKELASKLDLLDQHRRKIDNRQKMRDIYTDLSSDLVNLWLKIILIFREAPLERFDDSSRTLAQIKSLFNKFFDHIDETVALLKSLLSIAETNRSRKIEMKELQQVLLVGLKTAVNSARLPCRMLPGGQNAKFYGRSMEMKEIYSRLHQKDPMPGIPSVALHGMGGIGKTQITLAYAYQHLEEYDAIFWIRSETMASLARSFSEAVVKLGLPDTDIKQEAENRIIFLDWLQNTKARCLLIYDNAENQNELANYWPVSESGSALITTRNHSFGMQPAQSGMPIHRFSPEAGSQFILRILNDRKRTTEESEAAMLLSKQLDGHALALTQMTALIQKKGWSINKFLAHYEKGPSNLRNSNDMRWAHAGYSYTIKTVFSLSLKSLSETSPAAFTILAILAFVSPDTIPESLMVVDEKIDLPKELEFCKDAISFSDIVEELMALALIDRDPESDTLSIHRLVQSETIYFLQENAYLFPKEHRLQRVFEHASKLVYEAFPKQIKGRRFDNRWPECAKYSQHVTALLDRFSRFERTLRPSKDFFLVMSNAAWYCVERHAHKDLERIVTTTMKAFQTSDNFANEPLIYAHLCNSAGRLWTQKGNFHRAMAKMEECRKIRIDHLPLTDDEVWISNNNIGNISLSMGNYNEALEMHLHCEATLGDRIDWKEMNYSNLSRSLTALGRTKEAHEFNCKALQLNSSWYIKAMHCFYRGNIYLCENELGAAQAEFKESQSTFVSHDEAACNAMAAVKYKFGCIMMTRQPTQSVGSDVDEAISHLRDSLAILKFRDAEKCDVARVLYMLSNALLTKDPQDAEGLKLREQANEIRKGMQGDAYLEDAHSPAVFDMLVDSQFR